MQLQWKARYFYFSCKVFSVLLNKFILETVLKSVLKVPYYERKIEVGLTQAELLFNENLKKKQQQQNEQKTYPATKPRRKVKDRNNSLKSRIYIFLH